MMRKYNKSNLLFYALTGITFLFILISNPFLKIPYDMWEHLNRIAGLHDEGKCFEFYPDRTQYMCFWHSIWAKIFGITGINDIFVWARIIHVSQFLLAFAAVYYFCRTAIKILLKDIDLIHLKYLSFLGTVIWFIGNGTFSVAYQQAWIMWYSVNYQGLAMPLFWYVAALTLGMTFEHLPPKKILFSLIQIAILSVIIAKTHPMELLYFIIHLSVLFLINAKRSFALLRKYYYLVIPFILSVVIAIKYFAKELVPSFVLPVSKENLEVISEKIIADGTEVAENGLNRFPNSFSEIAVLALVLAVLLRIFYFYKKDKVISVNIKVFDYLLATSFLFFMIPLNKIMAGVASYLVTIPHVVWRFYFGSPWFVFLPISIYAAFKYFSGKQSFVSVMLAGASTVLVFIVLSKYIFWGALYKNTGSILLSLDKSSVGIQYSEKDIAALKEIIMKHGPAQGAKPNIYHIRGDLAPVIRGVFRRYVYMRNRTESPPAKESFKAEGLDRKYNLIDVNLPEGFPRDEEIFSHFSLDKR